MAQRTNTIEHRWGERVQVDIPFQMTAQTVSGIEGRLMDLSLSGALIQVNCDLRLNSLIEIRIQRPAPSECQVLLRAYVARKRGYDVGIEWCDFAAIAVRELFRSAKLNPPEPTPLPCHVLAVDDDALTRSQLMSLLSRAGYQVHGAGSGAEALSILSETPCPIVVTDWQMPGMDGLALCRALKVGASNRYTYVMMFTIRSDAADILLGIEAGVDDYVVKGAGADDLLARIAAARSVTRLQHSPHPGF
jgi:CheY-like chemotaxis protein